MISSSKPKYARPLTPNKLFVLTQPTNTSSSLVLTTQPVIQARNLDGSIATGYTGSVTATIVSGSGLLGGTTTVTPVAGVATFTNLTVTGNGVCELGFSANFINSVSSSVFSILVQTATALAMVTQPTNATSSVAIGTQPVVKIVDNGGATVVGYSGSVTATIVSGSGTLGGTVTKTPVAGIVTYTDLAVTGIGPAALGFSTVGLTSVTSSGFNVTGSTFDSVVTSVVVTPSTLTLYPYASSSTVTATAYNAEGQVVSVPLYFRSSDTTIATIGKTSGVVTQVGSGSVNITAQTTDTAATYLAFATQSVGGLTGVPLTVQPVVAAYDVNNTTDTAFTGSVVFSLHVLTNTASLSGTTTVPIINGVARATNLVVTSIAGSTWTIFANVTGLPTATSITGSTSGLQPTASFNYSSTPDAPVVSFQFTSQ